MPKQDTVLKKLRALGYTRPAGLGETIQYGAEPSQPQSVDGNEFQGEILNHTMAAHMMYHHCNFDRACMTGSIFRSCKFLDCTMDETDFEFCEFYDCSFQAQKHIGCSFNNSSFTNSQFRGIHFHSATFTGTFFQDCLFDRVKIDYSTLEGALFKQCSFYNVDFRDLNMDFIELAAPTMENVILSLDQIPFMFGAMQYLRTTTDSVYISKGKQAKMEPAQFFKETVPLLCKHFYKTEQFFPLANIYFAIGDDEKGKEAIKAGLRSAMALRDFRMLKYLCKLIAYSGVFSPSILHDLYNNYICRLFPQHSAGLDIPNYARHITEIKALLFSTPRKPSFRISFRTNISLHENEKLGKLFESIFSIGKCDGIFQSNDIEAVLQQNSPLVVTVRVSGEEDILTAILSTYVELAGISVEEDRELPVIFQYRQALQVRTDTENRLRLIGQAHRRDLLKSSIQIILLEYYIENFQQYSSCAVPLYYFNGNIPGKQSLLNEG